MRVQPFTLFVLLLCILTAINCRTPEQEAGVLNLPPQNTYRAESLDFSDGQQTHKIKAAFITPGFLRPTGVHPALGRAFLDEEYNPGRYRVVMLSERFWRERFNEKPEIIGQEIDLAGNKHTVIAVMPKGFDLPSGTDVWLPDLKSSGNQ